jgi:hypothetical protein
VKTSPDAELCIGGLKGKFNELMVECGGGRELQQKGFEEDVKAAFLK